MFKVPFVSSIKVPFVGDEIAAVGAPVLTSAEITSTTGGKELKLTFDRSIQAGTGAATIKATALFGMDIQRPIPTDGAPTISTNTATYSLQSSKPVMGGESGVLIDIPEGLVQSASDSTDVAAITDGAVTNNSTRTYSPMCRMVSYPELEYAGDFVAKADAVGHFGISKVVFTADDGVNTPLSSGDITARDSNGADWPCHRYTFDLSSLDDGPVTITAVATCAGTGGTRSISQVIYNTSGGTLTRPVYYVDQTSGSDSNDGLTTGTAVLNIAKAADLARVAGYDGAKAVIISDASYTVNAGSSGNDYSPTYGFVITRDTSTTTKAGVIIQNNSGTDLTRPNGNNWFLQDVSLRANRVGERYFSAAYFNKYYDCDIFGAGPTAGSVGQPSATGLWINTLTYPSAYGCHAHDMVVAFAGFENVVDCTSSDHEADFTNQSVSVINSHCTNRGMGEAAFTVVCTEGNSTIYRDIDAQSSTIDFYDDTNGSWSVDTDTYTTVTSVVAQINLKTGWTAVEISNINGVTFDRCGSSIYADCSSVRTIYNRTAYHSDGFQWFNDDFSNVLVNGCTFTNYDADTYWGVPPQEQTFWFDPVSVSHDGTAVVNVTDLQFVEGNNRSGIQQTLKDVMVSFMSTPSTALNYINNASTGLDPDNVYVGAGIVKSMSYENYDSAPVVSKDIAFTGDMHFDAASIVKPILQADMIGTLTTGAWEDEFIGEAVGSDLATPAVSSNIDRAATLPSSNAEKFPDALGNLRSAATSMGGQVNTTVETGVYPGVDVTAPTIVSTSPTDDATDVAIDSNIVLTFDENMAKGTGNIVLKDNSDDSTIETIDVTSGAVTIVGKVVTINPSDFTNSTTVYLTMASGVLTDTAPSPNAYAGISDNTVLKFTTIAAAGAIIEDTFARGTYGNLAGSTASDTTHTWDSSSSTLKTVTPGTCEHAVGNEYSIAFIQELVGQNDYTIEIDVSSHTNRRDAVIAFARSTGNSTEDNCYKAGIVYFTVGDTVRLAIYKSVSGVETELGSTILSADPTAPYTLTFTLSGTSLDLSWTGGSETVSVTDSEFASGGYAGLANYAQSASVTQIEEFRVTS